MSFKKIIHTYIHTFEIDFENERVIRFRFQMEKNQCVDLKAIFASEVFFSQNVHKSVTQETFFDYLPGLPDFSWSKQTKTEKIPNDHKLYQTAMKYTKWSYNMTTFSTSRPSKFYQNWDFWV
jgi:hypothetical protein